MIKYEYKSCKIYYYLEKKQKTFPNVCVNNKYHTNGKQQNKLQNGT